MDNPVPSLDSTDKCVRSLGCHPKQHDLSTHSPKCESLPQWNNGIAMGGRPLGASSTDSHRSMPTEEHKRDDGTMRARARGSVKTMKYDASEFLLSCVEKDQELAGKSHNLREVKTPFNDENLLADGRETSTDVFARESWLPLQAKYS